MQADLASYMLHTVLASSGLGDVLTGMFRQTEELLSGRGKPNIMLAMMAGLKAPCFLIFLISVRSDGLEQISCDVQ